MSMKKSLTKLLVLIITLWAKQNNTNSNKIPATKNMCFSCKRNSMNLMEIFHLHNRCLHLPTSHSYIQAAKKKLQQPNLNLRKKKLQT